MRRRRGTACRVRLRCIQRRIEADPQAGRRGVGIFGAWFGRPQGLEVPDEGGEQYLQDGRIAFLEGGVEDRTRFGAEVRVCPWREAGVVAAGGPAARLGRCAEQLDRRRFSCLGCGRDRLGTRDFARGWRSRLPAAGGTGEAGDRAAYRAAHPAGKAHAGALAGLGGKAGSGERDWHSGGLSTEQDDESREIIAV